MILTTSRVGIIIVTLCSTLQRAHMINNIAVD